MLHVVCTQQQNSATAVIRRLAAVLTTEVSTCKPNSDSSKIFIACRGAVIGTMRKTIDNRQSNTMLNNFEKRVRSFFRKRFKCSSWILCARGCCWNHHCEILLSETTRDDDPHNQHFLVLDITIYSNYSTNYDSEADSSPRCILSLGR